MADTEGKKLAQSKPKDPKASASKDSKEPPKEAQEGLVKKDPKDVKPKARPFTIYPMRQKERYLKGIIYGEYGVGKTTLAASADEIAKMRDVIFIDVESGDFSVDHRERIDVITPTSFKQFAYVHKFLRNHCRIRDDDDPDAQKKLLELERYLKNDNTIQQPKHYRTVIIDSLSEVQKLSMYQLLGIDLSTYTLDMEPASPEWAEWNKDTELIRLLVRLFRNLPMNVLVVCGPRTDQDERKRMIYSPGLSKALSKEVQGFVDFVGFMVGGVTGDGNYLRRLWLTPGETFAAKNRFSNFEGKYLDNPSMQELWNIIKNKNEG